MAGVAGSVLLNELAGQLDLACAYLGVARTDLTGIGNILIAQPWQLGNRDSLSMSLSLVEGFVESGLSVAGWTVPAESAEFRELRFDLRRVLTTPDANLGSLAVEIRDRLTACLPFAPLPIQTAVAQQIGRVRAAETGLAEKSFRRINRGALALVGIALAALTGLQVLIAATNGGFSGRNVSRLVVALVLGGTAVVVLLAAFFARQTRRLESDDAFGVRTDNLRAPLKRSAWVVGFAWGVAPLLLVGALIAVLLETGRPGSISLRVIGASLAGGGAVVELVAQSWPKKIARRSEPEPRLDASALDGADAFVNRLESGIRVQITEDRTKTKTWNRVNYGLGGAATLLSALGGAAGLTTLKGAPKLSLGILGLFGAGLAGTVTTIKAAGNAEAAETRRLQYESLLLDIDRWRDKSENANEPDEPVDSFVARVNTIRGIKAERPPKATKSRKKTTQPQKPPEE